MIKLVICDDDERELGRTKELCNAYAVKHPEYDLNTELCQSPSLLLNKIIEEKNSYDILLLDIYMPEMTGIELAGMLRQRQEPYQIVFLTTSMAHAIEAFSLHATHYLVKPFTKEQLEDALDKSIAQVEKDRKSFLVLKTGSGIVKVNLSDFVYSETDKHIQNIQLMDGTCLQIRISCAELFDLLQEDKRFFKCGSTYIINLDKISEVTTKQIMFDSKNQIPMQRRQYKELLERYTSYSFEEN